MRLYPITIAPVFPVGLIMLLFGLALAAVWMQYRVRRAKLGNTRALILSLLRLVAIAMLVAFALNPSQIATHVHELSPGIAIVVDTADSMGQSGGDDPATRLDQVKSLLTEGRFPLLRSLADEFDVSVYGLSDSLRPLESGDLARLTAGGNKGDIATALKSLSAQNSVVVLFSDGNLRLNSSQGQQLSALTVAMGNPKAYRDILISEVSAPALAFRGREVVIGIKVKIYGYTGMTLPILLQDSGKVLDAEDMRLKTESAELTTSLSFVPDEPGRRDLTISIPRQVGESIFSNNQINLTINVVRDKIRILMVSGSPSMNYRFMRSALKSDPSIDLLSFVILRTPSDILNVPPHEQSLIPFPVETLFLKEINTFDLLIFDNFDYSLFLNSDYLESIRSFVEGGGGFALIGGPNVYDEGRDRLSPIADILPFRFVEKEFYRRESPFGLRLTRAGAEHPLMRVGDDSSRGANDVFRFWQQLPPLDGLNLIEVEGSADVLLESADGVAWPILTVADYRKGRVVAILSDYVWKWYMGMVASGKGNQFYLRLLHRMVRWLTKDPGLEPVQIILPEMSVAAGQEIDVRIRYPGKDSPRSSNAAFSFSVFNPEGVKIASKLKPTVQPGEYLVSFHPPKGGIYRVRVETSLGKLEESMVVAGLLESLDAAPDHDQLKKIAASTGGKYLVPADDLLGEIQEYARKAERKFIEEKHLPIWATPLVMAVVLAFLSSEWYFRRRWGLI
ncbi:MAG: hypothetical protein JSV31_06930 [Desulfobacterales bacterium]|nr:MAG: hypothetical protein JSV31_06930 [Desulfobacterales bacterium]